MALQGKKLGILISVGPPHPNFIHGLNLAETALKAGAQAYLYLIDDAVGGLAAEKLLALKRDGLKVFACGYAAQRRSLPLSEIAIFAGLGSLTDLIANTDRFVSFN